MLPKHRVVDPGMPWIVSLFLLSSPLMGGLSQAQPAPHDWSPITYTLKQAVTAEMTDKQLPSVSIVLVDDRGILWVDGFGFEDAKHTRAASAQTVYRIGSLSQLFANIANLAPRERVNLDAPAFAERATQSILERYGMTHSGFGSNADSNLIAEGTMWSYDGLSVAVPTITPGELPAESMQSTAEDIGRFLSAAIARGNLQPTQDSLEHSAIDGHLLWRKEGAVPGFSSVLAYLPDEKLGVAVMTNLGSASAVVDHIAEYALDLVLSSKAHQRLPAWPASTAISLETARDAEGVYWNGADWVRLTNRGGRVLLSRRDDNRLIELKDRGSYWVEDSRLAFSPVPIVLHGSGELDSTLTIADRVFRRRKDEPPPEPKPSLKEFIGEYGWNNQKLYVLEESGQLNLLIGQLEFVALEARSGDTFALPRTGHYQGERAVFQRSDDGAVSGVRVGAVFFPRLPTERDGAVFQIVPLKPVDELRKEALAAEPPAESGTFYPSDFVEVNRLDPSIKLDIRYASSRNFLAAPVYTEARAYMQRPAAEAVARASQALHKLGYGLLIHDSYRPWFVTKMFWDGTPVDKRIFVADPGKGSRHNRGCAVDLTLYDLRTGQPIRMTGGYDEMSERSYPYYPGGASIERWHRDLLRRTMEHEGFIVNDVEWWHFDYFSYPHYAISNIPFEELDRKVETK